MIASRMHNIFRANIEAAQHLLDHIGHFADPLSKAAELIYESVTNGGKLLCCGNGGSACDAAHFVAEITGRYVLDRPGFPAVDLTANASLFTALINDFPPEQVFARQVQALGAPGDVLAAFSTSGNSANVRLALEVAGAKRIQSIAFLGRDGGKCKGLATVELIVPSQTTARIQEVHELLLHTLCEAIDPFLAGKTS